MGVWNTIKSNKALIGISALGAAGVGASMVAFNRASNRHPRYTGPNGKPVSLNRWKDIDHLRDAGWSQKRAEQYVDKNYYYPENPNEWFKKHRGMSYSKFTDRLEQRINNK